MQKFVKDHFYKFILVFSILAGLLVFTVSVYCLVINLKERKYLESFLCILAPAILFTIGFSLLLYYRKIVVDIQFSGGLVMLITNGRSYDLPCDGFKKVQKDCGRIYLYYDDGILSRRFTYQTVYLPIKAYEPDIQKWQENMPYAQFLFF